MLKDAKIHFFGILWFLFWRKKMLLQVLTVTLSHVMLGYRRFQKAFHSHPSTDYNRSSCPHGGEDTAIPNAVGRHSKKRFFLL